MFSSVNNNFLAVQVGGGKRLAGTEAAASKDDDPASREIGTLNLDHDEGETVVVEDGAFTITSTVGSSSGGTVVEAESDDPKAGTAEAAEDVPKAPAPGPCPRFGSMVTLRQGTLYLFGGMFEDNDDRQITLNDFYSLGEEPSACSGELSPPILLLIAPAMGSRCEKI